MKYQGRVLDDAAASSQARVALDTQAGCEQCARGRGCGAFVFGESAQAPQIECRTSVRLRAGQKVTVTHDEGDSSWLWLVSGAYGLPLLGMLLAAIAAHLALTLVHPVSVERASADMMIAIASGSGLLGGLWLWRRLEPRVLNYVQPRLCLQSMRVITINDSPITASREMSDET